MKKEFKIGDRVVVNKTFTETGFLFREGCEGVVCNVDDKLYSNLYKDYIGIKWDFFNKGFHTCNNSCKDKYGWFIHHSNSHLLDIEQKPTIIIYQKDNIVHAIKKEGNKVISSAKAICSPDDKFDFNIGARLAFERLTENEKVLVDEAFKPKLFAPWLNLSYGNIGEKTNLTALFGEALYVGDVVEQYNTQTGEKTAHFVANEGQPFIMGNEQTTLNLTNGVVEKWQYRKIKSFKDLKHNEKISNLIAILREE